MLNFKVHILTVAFILTAFIPQAHAEKLIAATSFTIIADMAQNIAGEHIEVVSITKAGAEIHDYKPTPKDILAVQDADIILSNGLNLERWFQRFLQDVRGVPHIIVTEGIVPISIYEGPYKDKPNPHAWMSIENALIYIANIERAFAALDPENAQSYAANAKAYATQISALKPTLNEALKTIPEEQRVLATSEAAFSYLAKDFGMKELYLWPINADQQGTPQQVKAMIDQVRALNVPVIFSESTVSDKPAKQIASETGTHYGGILYVDSLSEADGAVPTYIDLLKTTINTIAAGFKNAKSE